MVKIVEIDKCFECGSGHIELVEKDVVLERKNPGTLIIPSINQFECKDCGEKFLTEEQEAVLDKKIDNFLGKNADT